MVDRMMDGQGSTGGREPEPTQDVRFAAPDSPPHGAQPYAPPSPQSSPPAAPHQTPYQQAPPPYGPYAPAAPEAPSNPQATASLVLGIVSLVLSVLFLPAIIGVVLGIVGLVRSGRTEPPIGRGAAVTGIVLSVIGAALGVVLAMTASNAVSDLVETIAQESATTAPGTGDGPGQAPTFDPKDFSRVDAKRWESIVKDPAQAQGRGVVVFAEVVQFDTGTGGDRFLAVAGVDRPGDSRELQSTSVFIGDEAVLAGVAEGDVLEVYAEVADTMELETNLGGVSTVPVLTIARFEDVGLADLSKDFALGAPELDQIGILSVPVTVTNSGGRTFTYSAEVVAESKDGKKSYGTGPVFIENMKAGSRKQVAVSFFDEVPADAVFRVEGIERYIE
jgi:hypothetical protein